MSGVDTVEVDANGLRFHCLSAGDGPLLLCLHGFPDTPHSFVPFMERMAKRGRRVVAPFMRGYAPTSVPAGPYQPAAFGRDVAALIEALGHERAAVFGHDWGTAGAYAAAVLEPGRIERVVAASVPYGSGMAKALLTDAAQQRRSWYIFFFQTPLAELAIPHADHAFIRGLWRDWSPGFEGGDLLREAIAALARPGVLGAALAYYRTAMNAALRDPALADDEARIGRDSITVPTLYLHGADDGCIGPGVADGMSASVSGPFERVTLDGVGHFLQAEAPDRIADLVERFLAD